MSDENYNSNEETQALFVSSQKKKQAEQEARQRMEAEQARRDAAEAEVRRMEQEVEERKRRAEEERKALEEAEKAMEEERSRQLDKAKIVEELKSAKEKISEVAPDLTKIPSKEEIKKDPKKFMIIGGAAAAVVIVILVLVFALKGKGGKAAAAIDPATIDFNKEYVVSAEDVNLKFYYPEALYTEVTEEGDAEEIDLTFVTEKDSTPGMNLSLIHSMDQGELGVISAKELQKAVSSGVKEAVSELVQEDGSAAVNFIDEQSTDITADNPGKYSYKCTYSVGDDVFGAMSTWLEVNEAGKIYQVIYECYGKGENADNYVAIRDRFEEKNSDNALKVPGENPPKEATTDGRLEVDAIHLGLVVPKDQFKKADTGSSEFSAWTDDNGAMFIVTYESTDYTFDDFHENYEAFYEYFKEQSDKSLNQILPDIESRMYLADLQAPENRGGYFAEYKDIVGGINFWEGYCSGMWHDERTDSYSFYSIILMAPEKNKDIYKQIFSTAVDRVEDI
ncbi:MAG: hypothetical protein K6E63_03740 [Lachnospiraceae bacterium]|nr:hypothetical protein [Lachnospiraceae bacterium]